MTQDGIMMLLIIMLYMACGGIVIFVKHKIAKQNESIKEIKNVLGLYSKDKK